MPTYRLQKFFTTVYEIYIDADDEEHAKRIANSDNDPKIKIRAVRSHKQPNSEWRISAVRTQRKDSK